jgi:hypothetical protein
MSPKKEETMKKLVWMTTGFGILLATVWPAAARDDKHVLPIAAALESPEAKGKLNGSVKFLFGREKPAQAGPILATPTVTGKSHTGSGSAEKACNAAFLSAITQFHNRAKKLGAIAVVNIVSNYRNNPEFSSTTQFECHQGSNTTAVMLRGDIVK